MTDFWITDYGATTGAADNQSAINAAIAAAVAAGGAPNHRVRVPVGIFKHSAVIKATVSIIGTNSDPARGAVSGFDGTADYRAVQIDGAVTGTKQIIVEHLYLTGTPISRQPATIEKSAVLVRNGASNWIIRNNYVEGKNQNPDADDTTPNMAGFFIYGGSNGLIQRNTLRFTSADSIHVTKGSQSHHITIEYNRVEFPGDDSTAFVTYGTLSRVNNCISRYNTSFRSRNGRCFTSIGSTDCQILYNYAENTSQTVPKNNGGKAGVMIAAENAYTTPGSVRLRVYRNTLLQTGGTGTGHGAIHLYTSGFSYSTKPDWVHMDVTVEDNQIIQPRRAGMVINGTDGGTNTKLINNKIYGLSSGQSALSFDAGVPRRGHVNTGTQTFTLSEWTGVKPHAVKNIGGAGTTARHPADPLYNGEEPVPTDPVDPLPDPDPLPTGAVSKTITTVSGTLLRQSTPDTNYAAATLWTVDGDNPASSGQKDITILRFDNLIGDGASQIPAGATIHSAVLKLQSTDGGHSATFHKMLAPWTAATATWNSMTAGVTANDVEASSVVEATSGTTTAGVSSFDVKSSVQDWATGVTNYGWAIIPLAGSTDGWTFYGSAGATPPKLEVVYVPSTVVTPPPVENTRVVITGRAEAGANEITFIAPTSNIILRFHDIVVGAINVSNIAFQQIVDTIWTTGGPGTAVVNGDDVTLTGAGTGSLPTYAFRSLDTDPDCFYRVSFTVATNQISVKLGIDGELMSLRTAAIGNASYDFPAIIQPTLYFERIPLGSSVVTNLMLTKLQPHVWTAGGPGTVVVTDNSNLAITPVANATLTTASRPFGTIAKREYMVTYTQSGGDLTRNMGDTTPSGTAVSPITTSSPGNNSLRVWARSNQMYLRFYRNTASSAISVANLSVVMMPLEASASWTVTGAVVLDPETNAATLTSDGLTPVSVIRPYNTHSTATYAMSFIVTGGDVRYMVGSTSGGSNLVAVTTAAAGANVSITFTGGVGTTYLKVDKVTSGTATVTRPDIDLYDPTTAPPPPATTSTFDSSAVAFDSSSVTFDQTTGGSPVSSGSFSDGFSPEFK